MDKKKQFQLLDTLIMSMFQDKFIELIIGQLASKPDEMTPILRDIAKFGKEHPEAFRFIYGAAWSDCQQFTHIQKRMFDVAQNEIQIAKDEAQERNADFINKLRSMDYKDAFKIGREFGLSDKQIYDLLG